MYVCYLTVYNGDKLPPLYIGSTSIKKIQSGYCGSVVSKKYGEVFKEEIKTNKTLFNVIILSTHFSRKEAIQFELHMQKKFEVVKSDNFFNESFASINGMFGRDVSGCNNPMFGKRQTEETKQLIREKRGCEKRYEPTDEHRQIFSLTHKNKIVSDETRQLISQNRKNKNTGEANPMFGKEHSLETKAKISKQNTGKKRTEEFKQHLSNLNKGKVVSKDTKQKISESKLGKKRDVFSEEWRKKISEANKGRIVSDETKKKLSQPRISTKQICGYCGKEGAGGNMKRYHFEQCKNKL